MTMDLQAAGHWLLHSGIQSRDGGVARYYLGNEKRNLPVSTEITGYAASTYAWLYKATGEQAYLDAAILTARFLARTAWNAELETFPFETAPGSPAYFFDCGIIARGLLAVARVAEDGAEFREVARACARAMARDFVEGGTLHPIVELPSRAPRPHEKRWSREPGCFQLKAALPWRTLEMEEWPAALEAAIENHEAFLPGEGIEEKVMDRLHAYCYFLEGLLAATHDPAAVKALRRGIPRVGGYIRAIRARFLRSDVCAQLLRVRVFADALGIQALDASAAEEEAEWAGALQIRSDDARLNGAFSFGARGGEALPMANPVSTGFCAQALEFWRLHQQGGFTPDLDALI
ncbi:MAG: hypothetical protein R2729_26710 [Bryobacteraceae bacterium]